MKEFDAFEEEINANRAEEPAMRIKEYCCRHRSCDGCRFFIGTCKLIMHPCDWDVRKD